MTKVTLKFITDAIYWGNNLGEQARKGAALGNDCGKMCRDCAFNPNQEHTKEYQEAVDNAVGVMVMGGSFNCHKLNEDCTEYLDAGKPCAGMLYAKQFQETIK